jgi:GNAT superfamily N-acetyltransferase
VLVSGENPLAGLGVAPYTIRPLQRGSHRDQAAFVRLMDAHAVAMGRERLPVEVHARNLATDLMDVLVAESVGGSIVGVVTYYLAYNSFAARPVLWWEDGYVDEGYRDAGIGHAMHEALREIAEAFGCCEIRLQFQSWNDGVRRLHARHGAVKVEGRELWKITL